MRKIIVSNYVTLDGFFAGPNGEIDWFVWNEETAKYGKGLLSSIDTILFGRVTYELMAGYWPTARPPAEDPVIIDAMNNLPKIVFSKTLEKVAWNNSRLVKGNMADEVAKLKQSHNGRGKDIVIYGSGSLVSSLSQLGLIDEYQIFVNPVVLGSGKPLFQGIKDRINLKLLKTKTFSNSVALLCYQPAEKEN
jgi:dihydrofolate reductase